MGTHWYFPDSDEGFSDTPPCEASSETSSGDSSEAGDEYVDIDLGYEFPGPDFGDNAMHRTGL